ncbi:MAG: hypothetical protein M5R36_12535 [Deltaproteobacteria bacterium]|nr:hypothetical protein [Deltaproteobacteria bacterium]
MDTRPFEKGMRRGLWTGMALVALGCGLRLWIAAWPVEQLLATFVADDAFTIRKSRAIFSTAPGPPSTAALRRTATILCGWF